ncbi:MAG: hypothetical protein M1834_004718 [Cirrosporium novae-zelandiae]|nr:MAG: hypothetical protein M1834_004718 [Cirrosporium novae-zelandiae]
MEFILQPSATIRPNSPISHVVIRVHPQQHDLSQVWVLASLVSEDGSEVLAPPRTDLLGGKPASSLYLENGNENASGYAIFQGLSIRQVGKYKLRMSLISMEHGSINLGTIDSQVIEASNGASVGQKGGCKRIQDRKGSDAVSAVAAQQIIEDLRRRGVPING